MRKTSLLLIITAGIWAFSSRKGRSWFPVFPTKADSKYQDVMALPDGINVTHIPQRVAAVRGGASGHPFTWLYGTSVRSTVGDLTIMEFGAFGEHQGKWVLDTQTDKPFTAAHFAEWYSCPNAKLIGGLKYTDPRNWNAGDAIHESSVLWYFIGEDSHGRKFKGIGQVDTLAKTKDE